MVSFTRIPYAQAARRARWQDLVVYGVLFTMAAALLALIIVVL
jgi:hypothetical protein